MYGHSNASLPPSHHCRPCAIMHNKEGMFARRVPGAPSIQMNVPAIYHSALPPNITSSSSPGTLSTSTLYDCWQSNKFPFFRPTNGTITRTLPLPHHSHPPQNQRIPLLCVTDHSSGHTEERESLTPTRGGTPKRRKTLPSALMYSQSAHAVGFRGSICTASARRQVFEQLP